MKWAKNLIPTYPAMVLYLGVKAEAIPAETNPVEMFIADKSGVNQGDVTVYISSLDDPSIAPPGTHVMTVIAPSTIPWPDVWENDYRTSQSYLQQKRKERDRIIKQLEHHFPNLKENIIVMETGTPATIERYTLKNGGAVGGPKQAIGQEIMKRLHARSEWKNLYCCGDSTVMGMGTPAVTVSGVGAANMVLRDAGLEEYQRRDFQQDVVSIVKGSPLSDLPFEGGELNLEKAVRLAHECQYCEEPGCTSACPAGIDICNVMRKLEASNIIGAARTLHERNPLSHICGIMCRPEPRCEIKCSRLDFSHSAVRIAQLESWICEQAGKDGWIKQEIKPNGYNVSIIGAGPAGLAAAHWLARLGYAVTIYDRHDSPGGTLSYVAGEKLSGDIMNTEISNLMLSAIEFKGGQNITGQAVEIMLNDPKAAVLISCGDDKLPGLPKNERIFAAGAYQTGLGRVVDAVGDARRAVVEILQYFNHI